MGDPRDVPRARGDRTDLPSGSVFCDPGAGLCQHCPDGEQRVRITETDVLEPEFPRLRRFRRLLLDRGHDVPDGSCLLRHVSHET